MNEVKNAIQDDYGDDYAWCYGCGRNNESGLHLRTGWKGDKTLTIYTPREEHKAIPGFIYGGLIASVIDCHGTGSAALALHRKLGHEPGDGVEAPRFVTASLHVDFMKPTPEGIPLRAIGEVVEIHPKKWKVVTEVFAGDVCCAKGEVIAAVMPDTFMKK
ncbi:PaaI family thioesterase [Pseudogracilibacillus auburnensis]|uniref:Thioesterase superfamily protein n=1 Tax=Pseudogracilibacillus auburnensis TaxID=1494959 RepID=A0A2V3WAQ7_9BACI|nr:PaaI family thioesterase [Pseudogracilibacillus auburnensis]MBO1003662.1 PaaI family thioesterase [Pseudogracilibacillus auburnensis]PXW90328.1 thioesterase superfamily protein [Pseudogracilibacillus auburnensis]